MSRINNPKKSVSVDMNINRIRMMVKNLYKVYTNIVINNVDNKEDDFINTYYYHVREFGLTCGARAVITLKKINENTTEIEVEMQREVGSYNRGYEVHKADKQIESIFSALSFLSTKTESEIETIKLNENEVITTENNGCAMVFVIMSFFIILIYIISFSLVCF